MSSPDSSPSAARGVSAAALCYFLWGLVPLYWKQLTHVDPVELIAHRHVWSLFFLVVLLRVQGGFKPIVDALRSVRSIGINFLSATLLSINWLVYVWGVNTGHVIECSLGYFLVPLVNVVVGRLVLREHLRTAQWLAIGFAAMGVIAMVVQLGSPPWIALILAASWGAYSLMRKRSPLGSLAGLTTETLLLTPIAASFLIWLHLHERGALGHVDPISQLLVLSAGPITAIPLLLFAYGARRIRLSTLGLLQYIAPSVQLGLGVWFYHEPFSRARGVSFTFIWAGLALYTVDNVLLLRRMNGTKAMAA